MRQIFYRNNWKGFLSRLILSNCSIEVKCYAIVVNQNSIWKAEMFTKVNLQCVWFKFSKKKHIHRQRFVFVFVFVTLYLKQRRHKQSWWAPIAPPSSRRDLSLPDPGNDCSHCWNLPYQYQKYLLKSILSISEISFSNLWSLLRQLKKSLLIF